MIYDAHMHTPLCKHALGAPEEYAAHAVKRGLKGITFTCHSPMPKGWWPRVRMDEEQLPVYHELVKQCAEEFAGKLEVRVGIESDYFPGLEDWIEKLHRENPTFSHCLGSVHYFAPEYMEAYWDDDLVAFQKLYFTHLADSAETGLFDTLAHPDLIKNQEPSDYIIDDLEEHIGKCLDRIAKTGVAMELNTSGLNKRYPEMNPGPQILRMMSARKIPVVIGSDAHVPYRVAADFEDALDVIERSGFSHTSTFIERERVDIPIADARSALIAHE